MSRRSAGIATLLAARHLSPVTVCTTPMKIDLHTHILPRDWPDLDAKYGYSGFVRLDHYQPCCARMMIGDRVFREITDNVWDPQASHRGMRPRRRLHAGAFDRAGDVQLLGETGRCARSFSPAERSHRRSRARIIRRRFAGLATIPMQDPDLAADELERCVRELGLRGAQIGTHVDANPHSGRIDTTQPRQPGHSIPSGARRKQLGAAIFVHPWDMVGKERMPKYWLPWLVGMPAETSLAICSMMFGGVFERFPKLRVAFAHGGGAFPFTIGRIEHALSRSAGSGRDRQQDRIREVIWRAMAARSSARFYVDSLVHDPDALTLLLKLFGTQRVALGSDYPVPVRRSASRRTHRIDAGFFRGAKSAAAERKRARVPCAALTSN